MRKMFMRLVAIVLCVSCKAQTLSAADCRYVLELFCRNYDSSCFDWKNYIPGSLIIKSIGSDQYNVELMLVEFTLTKVSISHSEEERPTTTWSSLPRLYVREAVTM